MKKLASVAATTVQHMALETLLQQEFLVKKMLRNPWWKLIFHINCVTFLS